MRAPIEGQHAAVGRLMHVTCSRSLRPRTVYPLGYPATAMVPLGFAFWPDSGSGAQALAALWMEVGQNAPFECYIVAVEGPPAL